jgi:hypothetical protein
MSSDNNNESTPSSSPSWSTESPNDIKTIKSKLHIWPLDEYNVKLLNEVHPKNWSNENKKYNDSNKNDDNDHDVAVYDLISIGAGAGGLVSTRQVSNFLNVIYLPLAHNFLFLFSFPTNQN